MEYYRTRFNLAWIGVLLSVIYLVPNFMKLDKTWWFTKQKLNYGLDIQGGLHLVMGVDVNGVINESSQRLILQIKTDMAEKKVVFSDIKVIDPSTGEIQISANSAADMDAAKKYMDEHYGTQLQAMNTSPQQISYRYYDAYLTEYKSRVLHQAIETLRNRIDEFGVSEPSISAQGADRINVQLPGVADAEQAKQLINTSAKLDFMMVDPSKGSGELQAMISEVEKAGKYEFKGMRYTQYVAKINEDLKGKLPEKTMVLFEKAPNAATLEVGRIPYLVRTDTNLGGEALSDASVSFDEYGSPVVAMRFNAAGATKFADLTSASVGKQMSIVLDKVIKSAPSIHGRIAGGHAQITLGGGRDHDATMAEAKMISMSLRAGALPATLEQLEERRVGPTLGADSVRKAGMAGLLGAVFIFMFMLWRYKAAGLVSGVALVLNVVMGLAILSSLGATLTLPGIAGIALTIGFAVDSNVLIFERIREELHKGAGFKAAMKEGYSLAMSAILDANITTAITALILLYFGTGPVRGFAVTLLIGIFTTLFVNVFISKVIMDSLIYRWKLEKISV